MSDFLTSYKITVLGNEGGLNPGINENFTYRGIDEGANPHWGCWPFIHTVWEQNKMHGLAEVNHILATNLTLQLRVQSFLKAGYWDTLNLNQVHDQQICNNLFDCSINQGEGTARKIAQASCNYIIAATQSHIPLLRVDGIIGPATIAALNSLPAVSLMDEINRERDASYRRDRQFPQWGKIWESRLLKYKPC